MIKLAEYREGKFYQFLEIGKDFAFAGEFILYYHTRLQGNFVMPRDRDVLYKQQLEDNKLEYEAAKYRFIEEKENTTFIGQRFERDKKDPLARFNGLFDGLTYGNGRFVLAKSFELTNNKIIYEHDVFKDWSEKNTIIFKSGKFEFNCGCCYDVFGIEVSEKFDINKKIGNLHQNPELWEKVK